MRRFFLALALVCGLAGPAWAQTPLTLAPVIDTVPAWVLRDPATGIPAAVDIDCSNQRFWPWNALSLISVSRASVEYDPGLDGTLYGFANNLLPMTSAGCWIWQAHTNVLPQSQFASGWTATATTATINDAVAPDRTTTAALLVPTASAVDHIYTATTGLTLTAAIYTYSVYAYPAGYNFASLVAITGTAGATRYSCVVNLLTGAVTQTESVGTPSGTGCAAQIWPNGWVRINVQLTDTTATTSSDMSLAAVSTGTPSFNAVTLNPNAAGDGTDGALFWGASIELGTFPTSYCPTTSGSAVCAATVATMPLPAGATSAAGYSLLCIITPQSPTGNPTNQYLCQIDDGTSNNLLNSFRNQINGFAYSTVAIGGSSVLSHATGGPLSQNVSNKITALATLNSLQNSFNNGTIAFVSAAGITTAETTLRIGTNQSGALQTNGSIARIAIGPVNLLNR